MRIHGTHIGLWWGKVLQKFTSMNKKEMEEKTTFILRRRVVVMMKSGYKCSKPCLIKEFDTGHIEPTGLLPQC
jgi:hypothetical protein